MWFENNLSFQYHHRWWIACSKTFIFFLNPPKETSVCWLTWHFSFNPLFYLKERCLKIYRKVHQIKKGFQHIHLLLKKIDQCEYNFFCLFILAFSLSCCVFNIKEWKWPELCQIETWFFFRLRIWCDNFIWMIWGLKKHFCMQNIFFYYYFSSSQQLKCVWLNC